MAFHLVVNAPVTRDLVEGTLVRKFNNIRGTHISTHKEKAEEEERPRLALPLSFSSSAFVRYKVLSGCHGIDFTYQSVENALRNQA